MESLLDSSLVSVVLPTFNRASTLSRAIGSVLAQDHLRLELILIDDGSEDGTAELVKAFADPRIRYIALKRNSGQSAARNAGIAAATGDFVAFQDSDDEWLPRKLSAQLRALALSDFRTGVVYGDMIRVSRDGRQALLSAPIFAADRMFAGGGWIYGPTGLGIPTCLIRRSLLLELGGFEEKLRCFEDLDLFLRLAPRCDFLKLSQPLVYYHETEGVSSDRKRAAAARRLLLRRHMGALMRQRPLGFLRELAVAYGIAVLPSEP